ncbi:MAG: hypothetical protein SPJ23_01640 [Eubacteriales bacterium]|nr:hypothetical protein [Eubacteriales bacterium]
MKKMTKLLAALMVVVLLLSAVSCGTGDALNETVDSLKASVATLQAENEALKRQAIEAKESLANQNAALTTLKEGLEAKIADAEAQIKDAEAKLQALEAFMKGQYQIRVVDLDGEVLVDDTIKCTDSASVTATLTEKYNMVSYQGEYGTTIVSIAGSIVDANYYVSITENGIYSSVGVDGLVIDPGDVFEFKVECWNTLASGYGTMDEYDILVDKTIYAYMKHIFPTQIASAKTYTGSIYWEQVAATYMASKGYDSNLFRFEYSDAFKEALLAVDVTTLSDTNLMKVYYAQKSLGNTLSEDYIATLHTAAASCKSYWLLPMTKALDIETDAVASYVANAPSTSVNWGPDMSVWEYVLKGLYSDYDEGNYLDLYTSRLDWGNGTSTALVLLAFAKDGVDPRSEAYEQDGKDIIEVLFDTYYDSELNLVKWKTTDTGAAMSTNQIYASLMAYKVCRDTGAPANIFE